MDFSGFRCYQIRPTSSIARTTIHRIIQAVSIKWLCTISDSKLLIKLHNMPECVILLASFCRVSFDPSLEFLLRKNQNPSFGFGPNSVDNVDERAKFIVSRLLLVPFLL